MLTSSLGWRIRLLAGWISGPLRLGGKPTGLPWYSVSSDTISPGPCSLKLGGRLKRRRAAEKIGAKSIRNGTGLSLLGQPSTTPLWSPSSCWEGSILITRERLGARRRGWEAASSHPMVNLAPSHPPMALTLDGHLLVVGRKRLLRARSGSVETRRRGGLHDLGPLPAAHLPTPAVLHACGLKAMARIQENAGRSLHVVGRYAVCPIAST